MTSIHNQNPSPVLNELIEVKENHLAKTKSKSLPYIGRGFVGAAGGLVVGAGTVLTGITSSVTRILNKEPQLAEKIENTVKGMEHYIHLEHEFPRVEKELNHLGEEILAKTGPVSRSMMKHPISWVGGFAVAGAGLGLLWQSRVQKQRVDAAQHEIDQLKTVNKQWSEKVHANRDADEIQR